MTRTSTESIGELLKDAVYDPTAWPKALEGIDAFLGSSGVVLLSVNERLRCAPCTPSIDEMMEDYFQGGWYRRDLREGCVPLIKKQGFVVDNQFMNMEQIESTDFYQDFLRRHRMKWFAGLGVAIGDELWCLAIQRTRTQDAFASGDAKNLIEVQSLLSKSVNAASWVSRSWVKGALSALQGVGEAAFILDCLGRLVHINDAGQRLIGNFVDREGRIKLPDREANKIVADFVGSSRNLRVNSPVLSTAHPFLIGGKLYQFESMILVNDPALAFSKCALLGRLIRFKSSPDYILKETFGLTDGEMRVATCLYEGKDVKLISQTYRISYNTVRSHLKNIFQKTSVQSQSQFVALILSLYRE